MNNFENLKNAILFNKETKQYIEDSYNYILENPTLPEINIFINLLSMVGNKSKRTMEILKVIDFIRFPINKSLK